MDFLDNTPAPGQPAAQPVATETPNPAVSAPSNTEPRFDFLGGAPGPRIAAKKAAAQHDPSVLQHVEAWSQNALESPVGRGLNAVLNATSNFGVGTADALAKGHGWNSFAEGVNAVSHPGQASDTTHDLETRLHLYQAGKNAPWWGRVFETAQDFALQTALDPAMWIPGLDVASIVGKALKVGKVAGKALTGTERAVESTEHVAAESPNLYRYQAKAGEPSAHPNRGGVSYSTDPAAAEQFKGAGTPTKMAKNNPGYKSAPVVGTEGGPNLVQRVADAKNPMIVDASTKQGIDGVLESHGLGHLVGKIHGAQDLTDELKRQGVPIKDVDNMARYGDTGMMMDRLLSIHAKSLGHDAVHLPDGTYFALDKKAAREARPASSVTTSAMTGQGLTPIGKAAQAIAKGPVGQAVGGFREGVNKEFNADHFLDKLMTPKGKDILKGRQAGQAYAFRKLTDDEAGNAARDVLKKESTPQAIAKQFVADHADKLKPGVTEQDLSSHLANVEKTRIDEKNAAKAEPSIWQNFSRYGRDTLFLLPFAHMKNLSIMALLGPGGAKTLAKGSSYMKKIARGDAATLDKVEDLKRLGVAADYTTGVDRTAGEAEQSVYARFPGLGKLSEKSTQALTDYDTAMRLALYDHLKAKGMDDYTIGGHIRSTMGDYGNQSEFVKRMRNVGANFPAWRAGVVPRAMLKAIKEQPKNAKMYATASGDIENDKPFPGQNGAGFNAGSVPEDFAEMASAPAGSLAYGTSASTIGPIATAEQAKAETRYGQLGQFAEQQIENFVPFGGIISKIPALNTYSNATQANPWLQAAGGLAGVRFPDAPAYKKRKAQLEALHMSMGDIMKTLRAEGYLHENSPLGK
jgi:hypothetical protein